MFKLWSNFCKWLVLRSGIPLGFLAPHVLHMGLGGGFNRGLSIKMKRVKCPH